MIPKIFKRNDRILGINERNIEYVRRYNSKTAKHIADNKIVTKRIMKKAGVPTTHIVKTIKSAEAIEVFDFSQLPKSFVVKPVNGVEGGGIQVFYNTDTKGNFVTAHGQKFTHDMLKTLMMEIVEGKYSHSYIPDHVLIEERVKSHHKFRPYTYKGSPDIRIIVFRRVPVMAMVRWPTLESEGKANFAQGAVGSGIDIATGVTTHSVKAAKDGRVTEIEFVPSSHERYSGFKIPYWEKILTYAVRASVASKLGFTAVDFLIDRDLGPLVVELNARPGLTIQLANNDGMKWRLEQVKDLKIKSEAHAIRLGRDLFGGEVQEEIEAIAGKKLISVIQPIKLYPKNGKASITVKAKIDTGAFYSSMDLALARELGYGSAVKAYKTHNIPDNSTKTEAEQLQKELHDTLVNDYEDIINTHQISNSLGHGFRIAVNVRGMIEDKPVEMEVNIKDRSHLQFPMLIGRNDLKDFLIDPSKRVLKI